MYIEAQIVNQSIFFNFKSSLLYIWCIYIAIFFYRCLFLQVDNLNLVTNLEFFFNVMLIACKCMPFCKKLDCDTKNEPPYLATTLTYVAFTIDEVGNKDNQNRVLIHHEYYVLKDWRQIPILLILNKSWMAFIFQQSHKCSYTLF